MAEATAPMIARIDLTAATTLLVFVDQESKAVLNRRGSTVNRC